jgi:hypothetical protein
MIKGMMCAGNGKKVERYNVKLLVGNSGEFFGFTREASHLVDAMGELRPDVPIIKECYVDVGGDLFYLTVKTPIDFKKVVVDFEAQTFTFVKDDFYNDYYIGTAWKDGNPMLIRELMDSFDKEVNVKFEFYK